MTQPRPFVLFLSLVLAIITRACLGFRSVSLPWSARTRQLCNNARNPAAASRTECHAAKSSTEDPKPAAVSSIWTRQEIEDFAEKQGVLLEWGTLGPGYRAVARAAHNATIELGYLEGVFRPGSLLHLDKMEVYSRMLVRTRRENPLQFTGGGTPLGVGLLLAYLTVHQAYHECGCTRGEFLAIDDQDYQHQRLIRLYQMYGCETVRYVGDEVKDIPDRLVWGGCGTLMQNKVPLLTLLQRWTRLLEKGRQRDPNTQEESGGGGGAR